MGLGAQLVSGPAPSAMPGFGLYGRLAFQGIDVWTPAIALQLAHAWVDDLAEPGGAASFALDSARLALCPLGLRLASFSAFACATAELGQLSGSGAESYAPRSERVPWTSFGGAVVLALGLGARFELEAGAGVARPLRRDRFSFRPDVFHRVDGASLSAQLGAGVRFP